MAIALLAVAAALGDSAAVADDPSPEKLLEGHGLKRSGMLYVVDAESDFIPRVAKLQPDYGQLKAAYDKLYAVVQNQAEYDGLNVQWTLVSEQLGNVQAEIRAHPPLNNNELRQSWYTLLDLEKQYQFQYNELRREVNLRYQKLVSDSVKERLQDEFQKRRDEFLAKSKELRTQAESIKAEYDKLAKDDGVKKALETLKLSTKARVTLGPSPGFKRAGAWLNDAVKATSPESLRPAKKNAKPTTKGTGLTKGRGASQGKEKSGKSASKGTRANLATPDDAETRPN
jgi:hypothetical protein